MLITDTQMYTQILKKHKLECGNLESTYVHQRLFFIFILFIIIIIFYYFYISNCAGRSRDSYRTPLTTMASECKNFSQHLDSLNIYQRVIHRPAASSNIYAAI